MKRLLSVLFVVSVLSVLSVASSADVFNLGPGLTNLETVPVGDPGNAGELSGAAAGGYPNSPNRICGAVDYTYNIGKYEVSAGQYTDFLNKVAATDIHGLYNTNMDTAVNWSGCNIKRAGDSGSYTYSVASDWANRPVNFVSYWDACRFVNWLHNGQPTGPQSTSTTEDGAYYLNGYTGSDGRTIQRKTGWQWAVTSEDEWYKAAYYKGGTSNAFWDYPMQSDIPTIPSNDIASPDGGNNANFYQNGSTIGVPYRRTNVGEFENSASAYNTFDQGGNVWEFTEALPYDGEGTRGLRGGSFENDTMSLRASLRGASLGPPSHRAGPVGFRIAGAVPEPSSLMILAGGIGMILGLRRRRA